MDIAGGVCDYCNADEGCCWDDCPTVKIEQQADEIERLRDENEQLRNFIKEHDLDEVLEDWKNA